MKTWDDARRHLVLMLALTFTTGIVDAVGYPTFFVYTAVVALPAMLLILWLMRSDRRAAATAGAA